MRRVALLCVLRDPREPFSRCTLLYVRLSECAAYDMTIAVRFDSIHFISYDPLAQSLSLIL